ncbi:MAG TPA: hypothetical protein VFM21_12160 [Terriglobia bacterium]|nr:hypothetical protein [Terriglobia bacterium]
MIAALEESPRAREIVRQAFLPALPIQGGNPAENYICKFDATNTPVDSLMYQSGSFIGFNTTSPAFGIDLNSNVFAIGPKAANPGGGGTMRFRDDAAVVRWLFGIPGTVGSQDFQMYNLVNGHAPLFIQSGAASYTLYLHGNGNLGIGTTSPAAKVDVVGGVNASGSVVVGGTATKQSSGGPEKLSFQDTSSDKVCIANFKGSEANARFLLVMDGSMEWSWDGSDQSTVLYIANTGRMNYGAGSDGWLGIVKRNPDKSFEAQPRIILYTDGTGIRMTEGVHGADVTISRPVKEKILLSAGLLGQGQPSFTATGKASASIGSNTVSGTSTVFSKEVSVGDRVTLDTETKIVTVVNGDTQLTVDSVFANLHTNVDMTVTPHLLSLSDSSGNVRFWVSDQGRVGLKPVTFATLPTANSSLEGAIAAVSDSTTNTWGATISGGGGNHVLAYCDGSNWTVMGK